MAADRAFVIIKIIAVSTTAKALPSVLLDPSPNYKRILIPVKPTTDSSQVTMSALVEDVNISTEYFDALSRPFQTVIKQASPLKKDYVIPYYFDEFATLSTQYLPYVQQTDNTNDGKIKPDPFGSDSAFYKSVFPNEQINYSQRFFDGSPLQRVVKTTAEGNSWTGAGRGISYNWRANKAGDSVRLWLIDITSEDDVPTTSSVYAAGNLMFTETTDERGVKTISYADELGRTVLTKAQVSTFIFLFLKPVCSM